jgi:putative ABC transport system permease protein
LFNKTYRNRQAHENDPDFWLRFLNWFCPPCLYESIEGDLLEQYENDTKERGISRAKRKLAWNVLRFFRPEIILRNKFSIQLIQFHMIQNYIKVMLRNMMRRKGYAAITILGLTVGLTFSLLIGVFVWQELNVNHQLKDVSQLYIIEREQGDTGGMRFFAPADLVTTMRDQYPSAVENYYRFWDRNIKISKGDSHFMIQSIIGDSTLLEMFGFPVLYGDAKTALKDPYSIVITEKIAKQFFNKSDVVGETLILSSGTTDKKEFIVTAVLPELKRNSVSDLVNINAQVFLSLENSQDFLLPKPEGWAQQMISYVKLSPAISEGEGKDLTQKTIASHAPDSVKSTLKIDLAGLDDYYLITNNGASKKMVLVLSGIAGFILLLAVINFVNISIGSATVRLKEIGVRKVVGGVRKQIMFQFLSEAIVITFLSGGISLLLYELLRPSVENLFSTTLLSMGQFDGAFWIYFFLLLMSISIFSGAYPAFYMSSYKIIESLKGRLKHSANAIQLPRVLVSFQFLVAISIFISAIVITEQVSYFLNKDLGYDKSFVATVLSPRIWSEEGINRMRAAKGEFMTSPHVEAASLSWDIPNGNSGGDASIYKDGTNEESAIAMPLLKTDETYHDVYHLKMAEGTFFHGADETWQINTLVINEAAKKALQLQVGDKVRMRGVKDVVFTIRGVVGDFHFSSLRDQVKPLAILHTNELQTYRFFSFRLKPGNVSESIENLNAMWRRIFPDDPFDYKFMDEHLALLYKSELQLKKAAMVATGLMLFIVLTGILGVVSLSVSKRTKEIGIRKVLGATVAEILVMISKEYMKLAAVAFIIAIPLTIYLINRWLAGFAYRVDIDWWMVVVPVSLVLVIVLLVVSLQSLKTALLNPSHTLKNE